MAAIAGTEATIDDGWCALGPVQLGDRTQTTDIMTRAHPPGAVRAMVCGPHEAVAQLGALAGRPSRGRIRDRGLA